MLKSYYHATPFENIGSIFDKGILKGFDGVVYLTEKPEEAVRFVTIRDYKKILVIEVKVEEDLVIESFDHSQMFFKCRAFSYPHNIAIDEFGDDVEVYEVNNEQ